MAAPWRGTWLLIEGHVEKLDSLITAGIAVMIYRVRTPRDVTGIAFPAVTAEDTFKILGLAPPAEGVQFTENETDREGLTLLTPTPDGGIAEVAGVYAVIRESVDNLERWGEIEPVLREFASTLHRNILVQNPHGRSSEPSHDNASLSIRFWSCPTDDMHRAIRRERACGIVLADGQRDGCEPSNKGIVLVDHEGISVAEVVGSTLYVLFDLPHSRNAGKLMRLILELVIDENALNGKGVREVDPADQRTRYIEMCQRRFNASVKSVEGDIAEKQVELDRLTVEIVRLAREAAALRVQAHALEAGRDAWANEMRERFAVEYDKLIATPHVRSVVIDGQTVSVLTDTIFMEYQGKRYELGDYRIDIAFDGTLSIKNTRVEELTGQLFYHHPHVFQDRYSGRMSVCLGNIGPGVYKLIGAHEYAVAVQILIRFLHSLTEGGGAYTRYLVDHWKPIPAEPTPQPDIEKVKRSKKGTKDV